MNLEYKHNDTAPIRQKPKIIIKAKTKNMAIIISSILAVFTLISYLLFTGPATFNRIVATMLVFTVFAIQSSILVLLLINFKKKII